MDVTRGLETSNKTRFTSVHLCAKSVLRNEHLIIDVNSSNPTLLTPSKTGPDFKAIVKDQVSWCNLEIVVMLLGYFASIIMAVRREKTTLGNITCYWAYLRQKLITIAPKLSNGRIMVLRAYVS